MKYFLALLLYYCVLTPSKITAQAIPNNDFERWSPLIELSDWRTNSCLICVPSFETYIVQKDTNAYSWNYAAKFIYNNVYPAYAIAKFSLTAHPLNLIAYVKNQLHGIDTAYIEIKLFNNNIAVDSGRWFNTMSISSYTQLIIPVSQSAASIDSAEIKIVFGNDVARDTSLPSFWVDDLSFDFPNGIENLDESIISIFPNPVNEFLKLTFSSLTPTNISIYNALGQKVIKKEIKNIKKISINTTDFPEGIYYVKANSFRAYKFLVLH